MKKLGFGLMRMPTLDPNDPVKVDLEQVKQMVDLFMENGFTYFDTAWMYNGFASESVAKAALVDRYPRVPSPWPPSCITAFSIPLRIGTRYSMSSCARPARAILTIICCTVLRPAAILITKDSTASTGCWKRKGRAW